MGTHQVCSSSSPAHPDTPLRMATDRRLHLQARPECSRERPARKKPRRARPPLATPRRAAPCPTSGARTSCEGAEVFRTAGPPQRVRLLGTPDHPSCSPAARHPRVLPSPPPAAPSCRGQLHPARARRAWLRRLPSTDVDYRRRARRHPHKDRHPLRARPPWLQDTAPDARPLPARASLLQRDRRGDQPHSEQQTGHTTRLLLPPADRTVIELLFGLGGTMLAASTAELQFPTLRLPCIVFSFNRERCSIFVTTTGCEDTLTSDHFMMTDKRSPSTSSPRAPWTARRLTRR